MKLHLAAIAYNEKELETYVTQLKGLNFETVSDVKKSEDGVWYQALAKTTRHEASPVAAKAALAPEETLPVQA